MSLRMTLFMLISAFMTVPLFAQVEAEPKLANATDVLDAATWKKLDATVDRGLVWLATQQQKDGSFKTIQRGQPGVTAFCVMAFLAQGETPVDGKYQKQLSEAIDFIVKQQKPNGLIAASGPDRVPIPRVKSSVGTSAVYNHAISALALSEAYGQCSPDQAETMAPVIEKAIAATLEMQRWNPKHKEDVGGWRYLDNRFPDEDSDLSITGWHLMFLRSAKNAGFDVPKESIDAAVKYVDNCFIKDEDRKVHAYLGRNKNACTRAMAGAGILALAHAGKHNSEEARSSGDWLLEHNFEKYNDDDSVYGLKWCEEHYHYGTFLCTQAMFQLGGKYWKEFYPPLVNTLLANQKKSGAWPPEKAESRYGSCYSTSLSVLSLSVPNQMLPIFQR